MIVVAVAVAVVLGLLFRGSIFGLLGNRARKS
jgi:hypothetical protein